MQLLQLIRKTQATVKLVALSLLSFTAMAQDIGDIVEHTGNSLILRADGENLQGSLGEDIVFKDGIETAQGRMKIQFLDETKLSLTEHTEVVIDEYYYDPNPSKSKMSMKFVSGTARFATGKLGLVPKENIEITTPTATIAVRGTDFTTTVDELGRSLVILLPETECTVDGDCSPSGSITVTNEGGTVTLEEAYQATMVSSISTPPVQPVTLENLSISAIDNMFIVSPPEEVEQAVEEQTTTADATSILDFTDLDFDALAEDFLAEDDLEFTELDIDLLDIDFLQDLLVTIEDIDLLTAGIESASSLDVKIVGTTSPGFDKTTFYNTFIDKGNGEILFYRDANGIISIRIPITQNATIETNTDNAPSRIVVNDGQSILIIINQRG